MVMNPLVVVMVNKNVAHDVFSPASQRVMALLMGQLSVHPALFKVACLPCLALWRDAVEALMAFELAGAFHVSR